MNRAPSDDRPTVLIVDDEREITTLYASWLADGFDARVATSGEAALAKLTAEVDVVLLDRRMPDLSGGEVLQEIRDRGLECGVAMVTAVEPDVDVIDMGFDDYLVKPVWASEIRETVDRLVELKHHDGLIQEYFALASKVASLEASTTPTNLEANDRYRDLMARFETVKTEARDRLAILFDEEGSDRAFQRFVRDWDARSDGGETPAQFGMSDD